MTQGDLPFWGTDGEDGLPAHLPIGLDEQGNGPADDRDAVRWACWCGGDGCPLSGALALAADAGARRYARDLRERLDRATERLGERSAGERARWERDRLAAKADGVKLARSYTNERANR